MWQVGEAVRFRVSDLDEVWKVGLVVNFDQFLGIVEILVEDELYYAPQRLVRPYLEV